MTRRSLFHLLLSPILAALVPWRPEPPEPEEWPGADRYSPSSYANDDDWPDLELFKVGRVTYRLKPVARRSP